jgi:hypothetical protein
MRSLPCWFYSGVLLMIPLLASGYHGKTFTYQDGIESIRQLQAHVSGPLGWIRIGERLREDIADKDVSVAVTAAGAIPYFSELRAVDMLGLIDPWIPFHGVPVRSQPGHSKVGPVEYLLARGVNLVIGHPSFLDRSTEKPLQTYRLDDLLKIGYIIILDPASIPTQARMVEIPISDRFSLRALYLTPHPAIEAAITDKGWRVVPLSIDK